MIDFEKELRKYHESPEVEELDDIIKTKDLSDLKELLSEVLRNMPAQMPDDY